MRMSLAELEFFSPQEVAQIGFATCGEEVLIDRTCRFVAPHRIHFGSHVRLDSYTTIRGGAGDVRIGNYVHLSAAVAISGAGGVLIEDFCGLSGQVSIYSSNDDYSGGAMTNPMIPEPFKRVRVGGVTLRKHAIIGAGSVILPGVTVGIGAAVGALSLVNKSIPDFMIVSGNPLRKIGMRGRDLLDLEQKFLAGQGFLGKIPQ
jgi:acetyltransferase-like isoleucine patch superfamily enzyme